MFNSQFSEELRQFMKQSTDTGTRTAYKLHRVDVDQHPPRERFPLMLMRPDGFLALLEARTADWTRAGPGDGMPPRAGPGRLQLEPEAE